MLRNYHYSGKDKNSKPTIENVTALVKYVMRQLNTGVTLP
jgi:hypothetical protein